MVEQSVASPKHTRGWTRDFVTRLAITLGAPCAVLVASEHFLLPGTPDGIGELVGGFHAKFGIFALGVTPILWAYWLVETIAFLVPRWSRLRNAGPDGREKLDGAARLLALSVTAAQAFEVAWSLQRRSGLETPTEFRFSTSVPSVVVCLVGGVCIQFFVAQFISRRGLMNGLVIMFGASKLLSFADSAGWTFGLLRPQHKVQAFVMALMAQPDKRSMAVFTLAAAIAIVATWVVIRDGTAALSPLPDGRIERMTCRDIQLTLAQPTTRVPSISDQAQWFMNSRLLLPALVVVEVSHKYLLASSVLAAAVTAWLYLRLMQRPEQWKNVVELLGTKAGPEFSTAMRRALRATRIVDGPMVQPSPCTTN